MHARPPVRSEVYFPTMISEVSSVTSTQGKEWHGQEKIQRKGKVGSIIEDDDASGFG